MTMPNDPIFVAGDLVKDHRGELATVTGYRIVDQPGKSNRVTVTWDDHPEDEDKTEYYAGVFSHR